MSTAQSNTNFCSSQQPSSSDPLPMRVFAPIISLFAASLRPLTFTIGQGILLVAPLTALIGFDGLTEWAVRFSENDHSPAKLPAPGGQSTDR